MKRFHRVLFSVFVAAIAGSVQAIEQRIALVIGNATYKASPLKNPVNDAQDVAARLKSLGFEVMLRENTTHRELIDSLRQFSVRGQKADVRVVFYAGHGVQAKGRNYLLPVDTDIQSEEEIPTKSADVGEPVVSPK